MKVPFLNPTLDLDFALEAYAIDLPVISLVVHGPDVDKITFVPWCRSERDDLEGMKSHPLPVDRAGVGVTVRLI